MSLATQHFGRMTPPPGQPGGAQLVDAHKFLPYDVNRLGLPEEFKKLYSDQWEIIVDMNIHPLSRVYQRAEFALARMGDWLSNELRCRACQVWKLNFESRYAGNLDAAYHSLTRQMIKSAQLQLERLPVEILVMIAKECYADKKKRPYRATYGLSRNGHPVFGGVCELSQVNKTFQGLCFPLQFSVISIKAVATQLDLAVRHFTATKPRLLAVTKAVSIHTARLYDENGHERVQGGACSTLPRSIMSLAALVPNLKELDLFLHRTDVPVLRNLIGSARGNPMPSVKALRFITKTPVSLAFFNVAFPNLTTLSIWVHGPRSMTGWNVARLTELRHLKSLTTVQLFRCMWRQVDLMNIKDCFPNVERLLLLGDMWRMPVSTFGRTLAGLHSLRDLTVEISGWGLHMDPRRYSPYQPDAEAEASGGDTLTWSGIGTTVPHYSDVNSAKLALALFRHLGLPKLEVIGFCQLARRRPIGEPPSRIFHRISTFEAGIVGVDMVRDYDQDMKNGGPGDFWFKGDRAVMAADREWLKEDLLISAGRRHMEYR